MARWKKNERSERREKADIAAGVLPGALIMTCIDFADV
jgi:hypothetical protein